MLVKIILHINCTQVYHKNININFFKNEKIYLNESLKFESASTEKLIAEQDLKTLYER